jgi:hypothetical protein
MEELRSVVAEEELALALVELDLAVREHVPRKPFTEEASP